MSIAFLDPGNIESDLQAGAVAGFKVTESGGTVRREGDQATWVETPACHISPEWPGWVVLLGDVKFKWARKGSAGYPCQNVGCMGVAGRLVIWLHLPYSFPKACPWLEGATDLGVSRGCLLGLKSSPSTAAVGAVVGHSAGLALPATRCPAGRGDWQRLGRGLPSLLP